MSSSLPFMLHISFSGKKIKVIFEGRFTTLWSGISDFEAGYAITDSNTRTGPYEPPRRTDLPNTTQLDTGYSTTDFNQKSSYKKLSDANFKCCGLLVERYAEISPYSLYSSEIEPNLSAVKLSTF